MSSLYLTSISSEKKTNIRKGTPPKVAILVQNMLLFSILPNGSVNIVIYNINIKWDRRQIF